STQSVIVSDSWSTSLDGGRGGTEGPAKVAPLRVVLALRSSRGFGMVLLGNKPDPEEEVRRSPSCKLENQLVVDESGFDKYPDTLSYVYTRGHSTPRFSTLPPPLSSYPTSRCTTCTSVIPVVESGLIECARIATFNLDDYHDDPESPPPSPLSPFSAYQKMIVEADLTKRERTLIIVLLYRTEDMDNYLTACLEELAVFMTKWDVKPRVEIDQWETLLEDPTLLN
ncbi:hypothetical protein Tco_0569053, partial [Tanacetum coccineum]